MKTIRSWKGRSMSPSSASSFVEDLGAFRRFGRRVQRHWRWGRSQGVSRLIEEDGLNLAQRSKDRLRRWRWELSYRCPPGTAIPVYVVGVQRSGTNMVVRGFERAPEFQIHNENDQRAFHRYRLRPDEDIRTIIDGSRCRYVMLKPLCDSHRVEHLLHLTPPERSARAVWVYRPVDGRVRSAVAKFGDVNLRVLREIADGRGDGRWQAEGLTREGLALLHAIDLRRLTPESGAALFWYLRNALYFDQGLHEREDVFLVSYGGMVANPERTTRALCAFLGYPYRHELAAHVASRTPAFRPPLALDPVIRARCDALQLRLDAEAQRRSAAWALG